MQLQLLLHVVARLYISCNYCKFLRFFYWQRNVKRTTFAIITFHWYAIVASCRYARSNKKRANTRRQVGGHHVGGAPQFACVATVHHSKLHVICFFFLFVLLSFELFLLAANSSCTIVLSLFSFLLLLLPLAGFRCVTLLKYSKVTVQCKCGM